MGTAKAYNRLWQLMLKQPRSSETNSRMRIEDVATCVIDILSRFNCQLVNNARRCINLPRHSQLHRRYLELPYRLHLRHQATHLRTFFITEIIEQTLKITTDLN